LTLKSISEREDFAYFVRIQHNNTADIVINEEECTGPFYCLWYTKDGNMHSMKIGRKRVLVGESSGASPSPPVDLDHVVYTSRTA